MDHYNIHVDQRALQAHVNVGVISVVSYFVCLPDVKGIQSRICWLLFLNAPFETRRCWDTFPGCRKSPTDALVWLATNLKHQSDKEKMINHRQSVMQMQAPPHTQRVICYDWEGLFIASIVDRLISYKLTRPQVRRDPASCQHQPRGVCMFNKQGLARRRKRGRSNKFIYGIRKCVIR